MRTGWLIVFLWAGLDLKGQFFNAPLRFNEKDDLSKLNQWVLNARIKSKEPQKVVCFYSAIQYYPELKQVKIKIRYRNLSTLMQARPGFLNCFRRGPKRTYKIFINRSSVKGAPTTGMFTYNASVGVAGHELSHISQYLKMKTGELLRYGWHYHKGKNKKQVEQLTDKITLEHELGWPLYDFAVQCEQLPDVFQAYKNNKSLFYLSSKKMLDQMLLMGYR